eukprot:31426-Pelagococcus_subviridis.AAC.13
MARRREGRRDAEDHRARAPGPDHGRGEHDAVRDHGVGEGAGHGLHLRVGHVAKAPVSDRSEGQRVATRDDREGDSVLYTGSHTTPFAW